MEAFVRTIWERKQQPLNRGLDRIAANIVIDIVEFVSPYLTNSNDPEFYDNSYRDDGRVIYKEILAKKEFFFFLMHSCNNYESKYSKYKYSKLLNSQGYDIKGREDYDFII